MSWLVFALGAAVAVAAAAPGVTFGDAGEFAAAAATLSPAHPPGYPLYVLAGKAFGTLLPWGGWAWRLNLFSGLCGAGALALLFSALRRAGAAAAPAALAVLFLGSRPLWLHTNAQAEVFGLHLLLTAACLRVLAGAGAAACGDRAMAALGLLLGLATGAHHTLALAVPALAAAAWLQARPSARAAARAAGVLAGFALIGLSVQLALPLRSAAFPPLDWGHPVDLPRFLRVFLRRDYGSLSLTVEGAGGGGPWAQVGRWLAASGAGFGPAGAALALLGLGALLARQRRAAVLPIGMMLFTGPLFLCLGNPPFDAQTSYALERFWLVSWLGVAWLAAAGADFLWRLPGAGRPAVCALAVVPLLSCWQAAPAWGQRSDFAAHDYGRNLLRSLPNGAALFIDGGDDNFYTLTAALYADRLRPDLAVADRGGLVFKSPYGPDFRTLSRDDKERRRRAVEVEAARARPVYLIALDRRVAPRLETEGLLRRMVSEAERDRAAEGTRGRALWSVYAARHDPALERVHYRYRAVTPFYRVMRAAAATARGDAPAAVTDLRAALAVGRDVRWVPPAVQAEAQWAGWAATEAAAWPAAETAYRLATEADPARGEAWTNLGVTLERQGRRAEARAAHERAAAAAPESAQARFNLGTLLYQDGEFGRAAREFEAAARLGDVSAAAWAARAAGAVRK
ncbi:MAG: DUF2723 domain-containing protein [Elusimicrobia bacterium]|nr:DUF2723 domain-containing protein [Elusimicrobiota bacterium]